MKASYMSVVSVSIILLYEILNVLNSLIFIGHQDPYICISIL